jgi:hypothetical protein
MIACNPRCTRPAEHRSHQSSVLVFCGESGGCSRALRGGAHVVQRDALVVAADSARARRGCARRKRRKRSEGRRGRRRRSSCGRAACKAGEQRRARRRGRRGSGLGRCGCGRRGRSSSSHAVIAACSGDHQQRVRQVAAGAVRRMALSREGNTHQSPSLQTKQAGIKAHRCCGGGHDHQRAAALLLAVAQHHVIHAAKL